MATHAPATAKTQDADLEQKAHGPSEDERVLDLILVLEPGDEARLAALLKTHPQLRDRIIQEATEQLGSQFVGKALALADTTGAAPDAKDRASARDLMEPTDGGAPPAAVAHTGQGDDLMDPSLEGPAPSKTDRDAARDLMAPSDGPVKPVAHTGQGDDLMDPNLDAAAVKGPAPSKADREEVRELLEPTFDEAKGPAPSAADRADVLDLLEPTFDEAAPKKESGWIERAREYNKQHDDLVAEFVKYTMGSCMDASRPELDPAKVADWQAAHGVPPDGRCGASTVAAAKKEATRPQAQADQDAKVPDGDAPSPAS